MKRKNSSDNSNSRQSLESQAVAKAVIQALKDVDDIHLGNKKIIPPERDLLKICDEIAKKPNGTRIACLLFAYYALQDKDWDFRTVPKGARGSGGDKALCSGLVALNTGWRMTSAFEAIGTKSNIANIDLQTMDKFSAFLSKLQSTNDTSRQRVAEYLAWRCSTTIVIQEPIPPLEPDLLTYHKAQALFHELLRVKSSGYIQQFLIASLLNVHRRRFGNTIKTHKVHAADMFDGTAGDIEEYREGLLIRAYEVTIRDDWKNRIHNFTDKMKRYNLNKYVIIASNIREDEVWGIPAEAILKIEDIKHDIAVVDILDFVNVFLIELSAEEILESLRKTDEYLESPQLCNIPQHIDSFRTVINEWLSSF